MMVEKIIVPVLLGFIHTIIISPSLFVSQHQNKVCPFVIIQKISKKSICEK